MHPRILTVAEMRAADLNSEFWGVPTRLLMENAGAGVARVIVDAVGNGLHTVAVVAGSGGKAGDAFVAARHLLNHGFQVNVYLTSKVIRNEDAAANFEVLKNLRGVRITRYSLGQQFSEDVIIDGLLGTGVRGAPRGDIAYAIRSINSSQGLKVSIDVPSGVNPDTGEVPGDAVRADITVTMAAIKPGLLKATEYVGKLVVVNIGTPKNAFEAVGPGDVAVWFKHKERDAKKGDGGRVLVFTGSKEFVGAPWLTALGAWYAGADLVFLASLEEVLSHRFSPEILGIPLKGDRLNADHVNILKRQGFIRKIDVIVAGPGLGLHDETAGFVENLLKLASELNVPLVLDADALKVLPSINVPENVTLILTPHLGEASALLQRSLHPQSIDERVAIALEISKKYRANVLLKGPADVIAAPTGNYKLRVGVGHQDMSCGGTGDVLAGVLATALVRTKDPFRAACVAAFTNAIAGEYAYMQEGKASPLNILKYIPQILKDPLGFSRKYRELKQTLSS